ncbi:MAG: YfbM family protein [Gemmatimonadaceae bacterium]
MGMYGTLRRATAADVARLRANPPLVRSFLFGEEAAPTPPKASGGLLGFLRRLSPLTNTVDRPHEAPTHDAAAEADAAANATRAPAWLPAASSDALDLDKAWHGLHFLFTGGADGGAEPACFLLSGGEDVGEDDDDDVLARLLRPEQVRDFATFLSALSPAQLTRRFDPERMTALEIYPDVIWQRPEETDEPLGFLLGAFEELQAFTAAAAAAGDAVVICVA